MPKAKKTMIAFRTKPGAPSGPRMDAIVSVPFRTMTVHSKGTSGTLISRIDLKATNLGTRVADVAVTFEYFRLRRLRCYTFTDAVSTEVGASAGYIQMLAYINTPATESTAPASYGTMSQAEYFVAGNSIEKLRMNVPKPALYPESPEKWFATYSTGTPTEAQSQGTVLIGLKLEQAITNSVNQYVVIEGVIEFAVPNDPTDTLARMQHFAAPQPLPVAWYEDHDDEPKPPSTSAPRRKAF